MTQSQLERAFLTRWHQLAPGAPEPIHAYRFAAHHVGGPGRGVRARLVAADLRDWEADFWWPDTRVLLELEGGTYSGGRHTRGKGYREDCEKYNAAQRLGFVVLRVTTDMLRDDPAGVVAMIREAIDGKR